MADDILYPTAHPNFSRRSVQKAHGIKDVTRKSNRVENTEMKQKFYNSDIIISGSSMLTQK